MYLYRSIFTTVLLLAVHVSANVESIGDEVLLYYDVYKNEFNTQPDASQREMGDKCRVRTVLCDFVDFVEDIFDEDYWEHGVQWTAADRTTTPTRANVGQGSAFNEMIDHAKRSSDRGGLGKGSQGTGLKIASLLRQFGNVQNPPFAEVATAVVDIFRKALTSGQVPVREATSIRDAAVRIYKARNGNPTVQSALFRSLANWLEIREGDLKRLYLAYTPDGLWYNWRETAKNIDNDPDLDDAKKEQVKQKLTSWIRDIKVTYEGKRDKNGKLTKAFKQAQNHIALMSRYIFIDDEITPRINDATTNGHTTIPHNAELDGLCKDRLATLHVPGERKRSSGLGKGYLSAVKYSSGQDRRRRVLSPRYRGSFRPGHELRRRSRN